MTFTDFRAPLDDICKSLEGVVAATIMGFDGIPIETVTSENSQGDLDIESLLVEYSSLLGQVQKSTQMFAAGGLEEVSIGSQNLTTVIRPINEDFFLAVALLPQASFGKGRYLLRVHAPKLRSELS